jgi:hypothetical protein
MKRILLIVAVLACAAPAFAQTPPSTTQMQLVSSPTFTNRLQFNGVQVMKEVLEETQTGSAAAPIPAYTAACHLKRANYAQNFLLSPASFSSQSAVLIVGANVSGVVIVGSVVNRAVTPATDPPLWDSSVADSALLQAYRVYMNTLAGCVIN